MSLQANRPPRDDMDIAAYRALGALIAINDAGVVPECVSNVVREILAQYATAKAINDAGLERAT